MNKDQILGHEEAASIFQWIIGQAYPIHPKQRPHTIRMVIGRDTIDERECAPNENIVSISESGVYFWYRPYSEPGAPRFTYVRLSGLFDFMRVVVWPRVVGEWCESRLMLEKDLTEIEQAAVELYKTLEERQKEITIRDIGRLLEDKPSLHGLFMAARNSDVATLKKYADELPDELGKIGRDHIQALAEAILQDQGEKIVSQRRMLIFQILYVTVGIPMLTSGQYYDWQSPEHSETVRQSVAQFKYLARLARRRYANEFMAFCLSKEMLEIANRIFPGATSGGNSNGYSALITEFVTKHLKSVEYAA